jgi:hypothetical protein
MSEDDKPLDVVRKRKRAFKLNSFSGYLDRLLRI